MSRPSNILLPAINYDHTLVLSVELSNKSWVLAAQVPGLPRTKAQRTIEPNKNALLAAIDGYRARAAAVGYTVDRVIATYEAGWSGFWLARWLVAQGDDVQTSSRRANRWTGAYAERNRMASMPSCSCALCLLGSAASPACVRWSRSQTKPMRMLGGVSANGPSCSPIVSASRTRSALFWRRLGSTTIIRFFKVDVAGWLNCERASTSQSHRMRWPKLSVCSLGWSSYLRRLQSLSVNGMRLRRPMLRTGPAR